MSHTMTLRPDAFSLRRAAMIAGAACLIILGPWLLAKGARVPGHA